MSRDLWSRSEDATLKFRGFDGFLLFLGVSIFLAFLVPKIGAAEGRFSLHNIANVGVWAIFFFYGVGMNFAELRRSLFNWRLHLAVHAATFLVFPLIVLAAYGIFAQNYFGFDTDTNTKTLWIGIFYVAALPSTVSSSVVMVSIARGNVPAAIFNASISSLLGVFLTPLWMGIFLSTDGSDYDLLGSIRGLMLLVVLPVGLGILLNPKFGDWVNRNRKYLRYFDQSVVLLIVYTSFCRSFSSRAFDGFGFWTLGLLSVGMVVLFFIVYAIIKVFCRLLRFNREDTITVLFCGSKKSLMHGTAMANVLFAGISGLGILLLPIMLYHALQLVIVSVIAGRLKTED